MAFGLSAEEATRDPYLFGTGFDAGPERVAALLHEIGHAMGRYDFNVTRAVTIPFRV